MTFDPFANQGDTSAWDPDAAAANKRAAEKIFNKTPAESDPDTDADTSIKQDPHPPSEVPDPDIAN